MKFDMFLCILLCAFVCWVESLPQSYSRNYRPSYYQNRVPRKYDSRTDDDGKYTNSHYSRLTSSDASEHRASRQNAKFIGSENQEEVRTFHNRNRRRYNRRRRPCRRSAASEGRFLWDVNVYNVFPGGGFLGGHTPIRDPPAQYDCDTQYDEYYDDPGPGPFQNWLATLFGAGGSHNPAVQQAYYDSQNNPPNTLSDEGDGGNPTGGGENINLTPSRPTRPPLVRPGDVIGGVANTVNEVIQVILGIRPG